jgi:hypothetical protein
VRLGPAKNSSGKLRIGIAGQHEHAFPYQLVERFPWPEATGLDWPRAPDFGDAIPDGWQHLGLRQSGNNSIDLL